MTPHKNPDNLSVDDQLKLLRKSSDDVQFELSANTVKLEVTKNQVEILRTEIKDLKNETKRGFDNLDQKLEKWKSEIHDLIDEGFTSKAKAHDEEIGILNHRTAELRQNIDKLNVAVFPN